MLMLKAMPFLYQKEARGPDFSWGKPRHAPRAALPVGSDNHRRIIPLARHRSAGMRAESPGVIMLAARRLSLQAWHRPYSAITRGNVFASAHGGNARRRRRVRARNH